MTEPQVTIVVADDDPEDKMLLAEALREARVGNTLVCVGDGEELLEYLLRQGRHAGVPKSLPELVLLDLNMPRMDGREALERIRADPQIRRTPVIVMTSSAADEDIWRTYDLGANSYITKPLTFPDLVRVVAGIGDFWLQIVRFPEPNAQAA